MIQVARCEIGTFVLRLDQHASDVYFLRIERDQLETLRVAMFDEPETATRAMLEAFEALLRDRLK